MTAKGTFRPVHFRTNQAKVKASKLIKSIFSDIDPNLEANRQMCGLPFVLNFLYSQISFGEEPAKGQEVKWTEKVELSPEEIVEFCKEYQDVLSFSFKVPEEVGFLDDEVFLSVQKLQKYDDSMKSERQFALQFFMEAKRNGSNMAIIPINGQFYYTKVDKDKKVIDMVHRFSLKDSSGVVIATELEHFIDLY